MTENERQHLIEGYKALMQYGCQISQDHLNYDRILMPISLIPAFLVLTSPDVHCAGKLAASLILGGGFALLLFWLFRNLRSRKRIYKVWETLCCIEKKLEFEAYSIVHKTMKTRWPLADFTLKFVFIGMAILLYIAVFVMVLIGKINTT